MKKRILSAVLAFVMCLSLLPAQALAATENRAPGEVSTWAELQKALNSGGSITLVNDIVCPEDGTALSAPFNKFITLDLNGYTIDRDLDEAKDNGYVITNDSYLTIKDSSPLQTGKITGGNNTGNGGGIYNDYYGTITLDGGSICGNSAKNGGGIYCHSFISAQNGTVVKVNGGTICHNTVTQNGGGMYCEINSATYPKAVVINSGTICDNTAMGDGGGIWTGGHTTVCGGVIRNNIAYGNGGGLFSNFTSTKTTLDIKLTAEAGKAIQITGNQAGQGGGVYLSNNVTIYVSGKVIAQDNTDSTGTIPSNVYLHDGILMHLMEAALAQDAKIFVSSYQNGVFLLKYPSGAANMADYPQIQRETVASDAFPVVYYGTNIWGSETGEAIAWFLLPESNYLGGNARFLWSMGAVGSKSFDTVSKEDADKIGVSDVIGSQIWGSIIGAIGTTDARYTWWNSQARQWLNSTFYNTAFTAEEKQGLLKTFRATGNMVMEYEGTGIDDYVFLLSAEELISPQYGFKDNLRSLGYSYDSDPAKAADGVYLMRTPYSAGPGYSNAVPGAISAVGTFYEGGIDSTINLEYNLRPGINLDQDTTLLLPATNSNKNAVGSTLTKFTNSEGTFKLAMQTSEMAGFRVTDQSSSGNSVTFTYSGAATGSNRYITAAVVNENDNVSALVNLAAATSASGTLTVALGDVTLRDSDRLLVFCNQENGDKKTNFVSEWVQLSTTQSSSHVHSMRSLEQSTSCTATGISQDCWYCDGCEKFFADEAGVTELENVAVAPIGHQWTEASCDTGVGCTACGVELSAALGHEMSTDYLVGNADAQKHYHACIRCGEKDEGQTHTPGAEATETQPQTCTVCGYVLAEATGFTVTFDLQDHGSDIEGQSVASGGKVTKPANPSETDYIFGGWYKEAACTNAWDFDNDTVNATTTLYAKWTEKEAVSISVTAQTYTYDGTAKSFVVSGTPAEGYTVEYHVGNDWITGAPSGAGKYDVKITRAEDETYKAYEKTISEGLVINAGASVVTNAPNAIENLVYTGSAQALVNAGTANNGTMQYKVGESGTWSVEIPTATDAGSYTVYYMSKGNTNYSDSDASSVAVSIAKAKVTAPAANSTQFTYTGKDQTYTLATGADYTIGGDSVTQTNAGTYTITVTLKDTANTEWSDGTIAAKNYSFVIAKSNNEVITAPTAIENLVYTGEAKNLVTAGAAKYGTMQYKVGNGNWSADIPTATNAGEYTVYYKVVGTDNYKDVAETSVTVVIVKATPEVTTWPTVNGNVYVNGTAALNSDGVVANSIAGTFELAQTSWAISGEKTVAITFKPTDSTNYNEVVKADYTVAVVKRQVASVEAQTSITDKLYGSAQNELGLPTTVIITTADGKTFESVPVVWTGYSATNLSAQTLSGTLDLTAIAAEVEQSATEITASVVVDLQERTPGAYDYQAKTETYTGSPISHEIPSNLDGVASITYSYVGIDGTVYAASATAPTNAGTYQVTATFTMADGYGAVDSKIANLTINKAEVAEPTISGTYTYTGAAQTAILTGVESCMTVSGNTQTNAGEQTITVTLDGNHVWADGADGSISWTIAKASLTVKAKDLSMYVGGSLPVLTAPVEGTHYTVTGLMGSDTLNVTGLTLAYAETPNVSTAGTIAINISGLNTEVSPNSNYTITYVPGILTVSNRPVYSNPTFSVEKEEVEDTDGEVACNKTNAGQGETVTVSVAPEKHYRVEKVIVRDASGKEIETTKNADGTFSFKMPNSKVSVKAVYVWENPFVDVAEDTFYTDAVEWALKKGITEGNGENTFGPNASCSRAQMVTFLWRTAGSLEPASADCQFADVDMDSYYGKAVLWAVENGITNGTSDTAFSPDATCTRAQMATFLCRMADGKPVSSTNAFADVKGDAYYADSVQWAVENGITNGTGDNTFSPDATCTRAQMVTFLYRYFVE